MYTAGILSIIGPLVASSTTSPSSTSSRPRLQAIRLDDPQAAQAGHRYRRGRGGQPGQGISRPSPCSPYGPCGPRSGRCARATPRRHAPHRTSRHRAASFGGRFAVLGMVRVVVCGRCLRGKSFADACVLLARDAFPLQCLCSVSGAVCVVKQ
jgi:hypothetical protein